LIAKAKNLTFDTHDPKPTLHKYAKHPLARFWSLVQMRGQWQARARRQRCVCCWDFSAQLLATPGSRATIAGGTAGTRSWSAGFQHEANLDEGGMWPVAFALTELTAASGTTARCGRLPKPSTNSGSCRDHLPHSLEGGWSRVLSSSELAAELLCDTIGIVISDSAW